MGNPIRPLVRQCIMLLCLLQEVWSRGKMLDPPGRSSLWRQGYNSPVNHHDSQLFCGGYRNVVENAGKCGVCGDPYQGPYDNEAGGKYASGIITRHYDVSDKYINVTIDLAVFRKGYFEFRICPNNDVNTRVKQECLDRHLLHIHSVEFFPFFDGVYLNPDSLIPGSTRYFPKDRGVDMFQLEIPENLTCNQCVLQWKHVTGQFWGTAKNGTNCQGCGFQETYINCADISIGISTDLPSEPTHSLHTGPTHSSHISKRTTDVSPQVLVGLNSTTREECRRCYAVPAWNHYPGMDDWCDENCREGNCPPCRCYCGCPAITFQNPCVGVGEERGFQMDTWCWRECCEYDCPADKCQCSVNISQSFNSVYHVQRELVTPQPEPEISRTESSTAKTTKISDDIDRSTASAPKITTLSLNISSTTTLKPTVKTTQTTTDKPLSLSTTSSTTTQKLTQSEFNPIFDDPTNITGFDPTGIPLEGLSSSLFGQFFLSKVTKDIEDILDVPKDTEYLPNNVSSFFNLEDPFQSAEQAVSVSVITINAPETISADPIKSTSADPMENTGDIQTFINTSSLTTFASVDQTESKSTTTSATTTSTTLSTTTSKVRTTTKLPTTKTTAITTTTKSIAITNRTTTSKLPTTTTSPTRSRRPSINKGKQLHTGKLIMPPPPPPVSINFPYGKGPTFFSKFNKFLGTRKRPRITAAASSPYTRVHNRGPYTTVSVGSKRLRKTTTTESPHIKVHNRRPHTTASVQNKGLHKTTTTESPFTRIQKKRTHTTENVQNKGLRISTTTVSPYIRAQNRRPHTTENVQNKGLHISTTTVSPYVNRKQNAGRVEEQKPRSVITTLSPAKNAESGQGQNRSTLGSVHSISESTPKSVNDRKPTTESLPIVTSSKKEAKTKDAVSTKTKPAKVPRPSEEVIPDVVPYLIFFPDERNDKYEGFSKNPPNKLEIKKPKISFRSRTTSATHVVDPPRKAKEKLDITQRKFFGNFSSNMNLKLNRKTPKEESYTKIKMKEHGPTSHPLSASLNKIKTNVEGNSSSNFKVTQFNNTQVGKDGGKIYMDENLPTFEPYVPNNETNSTDLYTEVKNVVHHNFVLNGLIENMGTLLKNGESKIHFLLKGNRERDKSKRKPIKATENVQLVDGNFIPTQEQEKLTNPQGEETRPKGEVTRSRDLIKSQDVQNKMAGNQDLTHSQRDAQVNIDLDNTLSENTKKQRTAKEKMNPVEFSAKNVNVFKGNSAISRKAENIETTTSKTVHQTVRPFPAHMTRLRPTNQSKDRKVMSALMSFPPPPPPSPIYYKNLNKKTPSNPSPAKRDQTSRDVIGTIPPEINRAEKKTTVKFPPVPSIYPSNERSPIPAPTPIRVKTTNPTKVTTTTAPPTTTQKTTTRAPKTVTPNLYYPTIPRGLTTTVYKISQIFFPPDFTQRRSLTDIINADPNKVPGTYTKTVYPPTLKQINATDVMLSTPYHVKDSVSKVPLLTSGTTVSTVRQKAPGIKGLPRNIKQTESESTSSPYLRSKLEVPDPFTTGNNDITTQSESPHVFKHANGSALTTNVRKQTKEVKTFRNVGINILKEIFKSPKVKKQDVLSGKVKLPQGKNAVILDIGLMNKIMDTFRRWLASMKLLVVEK